MRNVLIAVISLLATAAGAKDLKSNQNDLQLIMSELMYNTQSLSHAILIQDFAQIEKSAASIAYHPKPSAQTLKTVKQTLNKEMSSFKQYDNAVHQAALKLADYAKSKDIQLVTGEYLRMYQGCQSCHIEYQQRISNALKDK